MMTALHLAIGSLHESSVPLGTDDLFRYCSGLAENRSHPYEFRHLKLDMDLS
jgi:hypothetical protein